MTRYLSKYIDPLTDYGFKKLFGEEGSKHLLVNFLNDILPIKDKIISLDFKQNEHQGDKHISRKVIYDVFCVDEKGNRFIVEMQNAKQTYFRDRTIFYSTFPIRDQAIKGDWDFKLQAVYCVALLGFELNNNKNNVEEIEEKQIIDKEDYYNEVKLKNQKNEVFYDKLTFVYIELPKFKKLESELENHFEKWLYFLKNLSSFESIPEILNEPVFKEAFEVAKVANFTQKQIDQYEDSLKIYRDNINIINTSRREGLEEGREEGLKQGMQQGMQQGLEEGKKIEKLQNARNLLKMGATLEMVSVAIGLTIEELDKLK